MPFMYVFTMLFVQGTDLTKFAGAGATCKNNNCKNTHYFTASTAGHCASACAVVPTCQGWSYGDMGAGPACFLHNTFDDAKTDKAPGWVFGKKGCSPVPALHGSKGVICHEYCSRLLRPAASGG